MYNPMCKHIECPYDSCKYHIEYSQSKSEPFDDFDDYMMIMCNAIMNSKPQTLFFY